MKRLALVVFVLTCTLSLAQVKDKSWLLIDSVSYNEVDPVNLPFLDSVLTLYHKAAQDSERIKLLLTLAETIENDKVWVRYNKLAYDLALKGGNRPFFLLRKADALNNMGFHADETGDKQSAIKYYSEALNLREKLHDKNGIANSLNNLGYVFDDLGDLAKAQEYYGQSLKLREEMHDSSGMVNCLNNLGALQYTKKDFLKAIGYHTRSLRIARAINYKRGIGYALNNLGNTYRQMGDLKKAKQYQDSAIKFRLDIGDLAGLSGTYYNYSVIYYEMKDFKKAEEFAVKAMETARKAGHHEKTREAAYLLYETYRHARKFEQALDMHLLYVRMRDSSNNADSRKAAVRQQFKYEYEKKEAALKAEQEKKDAIAETDRKRQNLFLMLVGAIALAIGVVALVVIRSLRVTRRQKLIIERQKHIVEEKQKEILDSIHYAKRIQRSLLPSERYIEKNLRKLHKSTDFTN